MTIRKKGNQWCVESESGKNLGCSDSKDGAQKRLATVEYFKHAHKSLTVDEIVAGLDEKALTVSDGELIDWAYAHKSMLMEKGLTFPGLESKGLFSTTEFTRPSYQLSGREVQSLLFNIFAGAVPPSLQLLTFAEAIVPTRDKGVVVIDDAEHCYELTVQLHNAGSAVLDAQRIAAIDGGAFDAEDAFAHDLIEYLRGRQLTSLVEVRPTCYGAFNDGAEFLFGDGSSFCVYVRNLQQLVSDAPAVIPETVSEDSPVELAMDVYAPPLDGEWVEEKAFASDSCLSALYTQFRGFYSGDKIEAARKAMNAGKYGEAAQYFTEARNGFDQAHTPEQWKCLNNWAQYAMGLTLPPKAVGANV